MACGAGSVEGWSLGLKSTAGVAPEPPEAPPGPNASFSFLSGSFARGFLVFLSLKCFRTQILLRWLPLGMDLSSAQSEVRRPSPTLSGLPAPPSTAPSGSAGPSLVSSRSAASAASDLRALSARRPLQWALEPPAPLLLRNQEFRLESLSRTSLATMQNYLLTNLSATGVKDQKKILLISKKLQKDQKILLLSKKYPQKPIPSSTIERTTPLCPQLRANCSHR